MAPWIMFAVAVPPKLKMLALLAEEPNDVVPTPVPTTILALVGNKVRAPPPPTLVIGPKASEYPLPPVTLKIVLLMLNPFGAMDKVLSEPEPLLFTSIEIVAVPTPPK